MTWNAILIRCAEREGGRHQFICVSREMASSSSDRGQPSGGAEVDWDSLMQLQEMVSFFFALHP